MSNPAIFPAIGTLALFFAVGLALSDVLYPRLEDRLEAVVLGFALGSGAATMLLFLGFLIVGWVAYLPVFAALLGVVLWRAHGVDVRTGIRSLDRPPIPETVLGRAALGVAVMTTVLVVFRAGYWPFYTWDALSHWALRAQTTYQTGVILPRLPSKYPGQLHNQYPLWLPLAYDWVAFFNQGWAHVGPKLVNAAVYPALLGSTYLLGREAGDKQIGTLAVLGVCFTPLLSMFAAIGYADVPLAFFTTLATYYGLRAVREARWRHFFTAGLLAGLGGWTKLEGAVMGVLFLAVLGGFALYEHHDDIRRVLGFSLAAGVGFSIPIGPWYLYLLATDRLSGGGSTFLSIPTLDPGRAIEVLVVLLQTPTALEPYAPLGVLIVLGYGFMAVGGVLFLWLVIRREVPFVLGIAGANVFFVYYVFYQTYHDLWFLLTTSAPRYLVHFEPVIVVPFVIALRGLFQNRFDLGERWQLSARIQGADLLSVIVVAFLLFGAIPISSGAELGADRYALVHGDDDVAGKYQHRLGDTFATMETIDRTAESGDRVYIIDNYWILAPYFLEDQTAVPPFLDVNTTTREAIHSPTSADGWVTALREANIEYVAIAGPGFVKGDPDRERQARFAASKAALKRVWHHETEGDIPYVLYKVTAEAN